MTKGFEIDFLTEYDDESLITELRRIAEATGSDTVSKVDIETIGRVSYSCIHRRFGSLRHAMERAGLKTHLFTKATDEELIAIILDLWQRVLEKEGRSPQKKDLEDYGFPVSEDTICRRFGTWRKGLVRAHASITEESISTEVAEPDKQTKEPRKRSSLSIRKRFFVLKRDHFACVRCGASGFGVRLEVHHRIPFAQGGSDNLSNLETLCFDCNRGQSDSLA